MAPKAQSASYILVNMGPDFKIYIDQYRNSDADKRWRGWKEFEKKYQPYFDQSICDSSLKDCEKQKQDRLNEFFTKLPTFEKAMWEIFKNADVLSRDQIQNFKTMFPDFKQDVPIVFMPSLLRFNGIGGLKINGTYTLAIGADLAALRNNNMGVLFSHELFHAYQFEKLKNTPTYQTLSSPLWFEGLATWVSTQLNPKATEADILMNQELATFCASHANVKAMANDYKSFLKMSNESEKSKPINSAWFSANGEAVPRRRGYCLGLRAIAELTKKKRVGEILSLKESSFSDLLANILEDLSKL